LNCIILPLHISPSDPCGQFICFILDTSRLLHYHTQLNNQPLLLLLLLLLLPYSTINHYCYSIIDVIIITAYFGVLVLVFLKKEKLYYIKLALSF